MFGIFKSKAEREQEKLDKEIAKTERFLSDDKKMSDINKKRRELDKKKARRDDSNFRDKVFETNVKLNKLEEKFVMKIVTESNAVKYEREHNQSSKKSERRLKNAYLSLVMVKHAKKRLIEIENERDWNLAMRDLSGAIKTMNGISLGSQNIQKTLFQFRAQKMGWLEDNESSGWFNEKTEEKVSNAEVQKVMNSDPIDLLVADDIYDTLLDDPTTDMINEYASKSIGVDTNFEQVSEFSEKQEQSVQAEPVSISDDEFDDYLRDWGKV